MGETTVEDTTVVAKAKPTIVVPQRGSMESIFTNELGGLGFSPGPITLVSRFFSEQGSFSFSQLLAGAMVSPIVAKQGFLLNNGSGKDENGENDSAGYKRNRPENLVVAPPQMQLESLSPLFMVPPGLSPSGLLNSPGFLSPIQSPFGMSHQQALAHVTAQATISQSYMQMQAEFQHSSAPTAADHSSSAQIELESSKIESPEVAQRDKRVAYSSGEKPAGDGYNWRKYGQKHVKASECPRSYYKCTHLNCPVKKKVERSGDGRISEIVYKGHHNHDPPQNNKRGKDSSAMDKTVKPQIDSDSVNFPEATQLAGSCNDEMEDNVIVIGDMDDDDDEPAAKRRDTGNSTNVLSRQTTTESKIVVQTRSEVDLLDDGYKWRKYGQKVVKGNPYPRSYYRCTYSGCNVRKHVERSSADPKAVITTYEGKHNHELPAGRHSNSSHGGLKAQKGIGSTDQQMSFTLHLKEEQIAA